MEDKLIVIKLCDETLLEVSRNILIQDSPKFKQLLVDLKFEEHEIDDFSPQVARLFVSLLEKKQLKDSDIDNSNFRELHKIAAAFEVVWLKDACYEWLKKLMKSCQTESEKSFLFEECSYIFRKWKDETLMNELITCLIQQDNSVLIEKYLEDISKLETFQIDTILKIGGCNVGIFLKNIMKNLEGKTQLEKKMKYLLKTMNLAVCSELNHDLYLDVIDRVSNLEEISAADLRFTLNTTTDVSREVRKRAKNRNVETIVMDLEQVESIGEKCHKIGDIQEVILVKEVNTMLLVVELLLKVFYTNQPRKKEAEEFVTATETICDLGYEIQKVSRMYLDTIISALNYSNLEKADQLGALLEDIKKSDKLSTNHEVALIDCAVSVASGANRIKHMYHFKHPAVEKCNKAGRCGFIIEVFKDSFEARLLVDEEDYKDTGVHFHEVIRAADMQVHGQYVGHTSFDQKITAVGKLVNLWAKKWLPYVTDWKMVQMPVAYDISKYLLYKPVWSTTN